MLLAAKILIVIVALLHFFFLIIEMFLWTKPFGRRTFGLQEDFARESKTLAANQGLYNGFLAVGLLWGLLTDPLNNQLTVFALGCVVIAGLYGGITVNRRILWIQALPAVLALAFLRFSLI